MAEFFHMGGHGMFIWTGYAITIVLMIVLYFAPVRKMKSLKRELIRYYESLEP